jgi:PAS domain S-box-containing protein
MASGAISANASGSSGRRLRRAILLIFVAMFVCIAALRIGNLWAEHTAHIEAAERRAENLAHILGAHLERTISAIDAALAQLALHSQRVGGPYAQPQNWTPILEAVLPGLEGVGSLTVISDGGLVTQSTVSAAVGQSRTDRFLFRELARYEQSGLVADTLFRALQSDRPVIPLGRRIVTVDGRFDGVVVATLEVELLRQFYRSVDLDEGGVIALFHAQGEAILREPVDGNVQLDKVLLESAQTNSQGALALIGSDGDRYLTAYSTIAKLPLVISVALSEDAALEEWREEALTSLLGLALVALLLGGAWFMINRQIRARLEADARLQRNRARFHEIMFNAPILVSVKDTAGRFLFLNHALEKLLGTTLKEAEGKSIADVVDPGPAGIVAALDREVIDTRRSIQREVSYQTDAGFRTALFVKFPLFDQDGNVEAVASFSTDITDQRRKESWFKTIMDHAPSFVVLKDLEGRYLFVNHALEKRIGVKAAEFVGKTTADFFPADYSAKHDALDREVLETRVPIQREMIAVHPEGVRTILFGKFPIFDAAGNLEGVGSIGTDITDQKHTQSQLVHAQRMEAVGKLTGGIAHDFNNLLTVIIGNIELLATELKNNARLQPLAQVALDAAERSAALTQRLLAFARRQVLEPRATDINALVRGIEDLIERAAGENSKVEYRFADDLYPAIIDPSQLETAILNLVVNSRDAMPYGGRITIQTANGELDASYAQMYPEAKPGEYIVVSVTDTGNGMSPEVLSRAFEPFFTTKEVGKGTGLGLPTIYGFIKQSGGHVQIYSEVGHGTVVRLYIPRAESPSIVPDLPSKEVEELPTGTETILLVEDDKLVREHTERQLASLGYQVMTATGPEEAMKIASVNGKPDLLLTDIIMPGGQNGRELAARMRERWADLKVLCTSGYTDGAIPEFDKSLAEGLHFLQKPFRRKDLALKVREALDAPAPIAAADWA